MSEYLTGMNSRTSTFLLFIPEFLETFEKQCHEQNGKSESFNESSFIKRNNCCRIPQKQEESPHTNPFNL